MHVRLVPMRQGRNAVGELRLNTWSEFPGIAVLMRYVGLQSPKMYRVRTDYK